MQESWEEMRGREASKVNNGGRERKFVLGKKLDCLGKRGVFYMSPQEKEPLQDFVHRRLLCEDRRLWKVSGVVPGGAGTRANPRENFHTGDSGLEAGDSGGPETPSPRPEIPAYPKPADALIRKTP